MFRSLRTALLPCAALVLALIGGGCGDSSGEESRPAPTAAEFPAAQGKTIGEVLHDSGAKPSNLVVAPAAASFVVGPNRYPFGVFTTGNEQISDADVALYFAKDGKSPVQGPLPAELVSLETKPAYHAAASGDASSAYVVPTVNFDRPGPWIGIAMLKGPDGLEATRLTSPPDVGRFPRIPEIGEKAPVVHTPTAADVGGDLSQIDTRVPPDQMHEVDFADAAGEQPVVLVFATPALCQSRVCGPVVDVVQQVADQHRGEADFIHMEVYEDNDPSKPVRPQLRAFGLETEPWTFLIDRNGVVRDRIEGAFGVSELEEAMKKILPGRAASLR
jgi:hypothetical protein